MAVTKACDIDYGSKNNWPAKDFKLDAVMQCIIFLIRL